MGNFFTYLQLFSSFLCKLLVCLIGFSVLFACVTIQNFAEDQTPLWSGDYTSSEEVALQEGVKVVSYNIKYAKEIDSAIEAFTTVAELKNADIILLQEMDTIGTMKIAESLNMNYVYVPSVLHGKKLDYFGNSILSKWPMPTTEKIILPHRAKSGRQRIGVYAVIDVHGKDFHVYNIHLETMTMKREKRGGQLEFVANHSRTISKDEPVIIAGDFNSFFPKDRILFADLMDKDGYTWHTKELKYTAKALLGLLRPQIDQCFGRGFTVNELGVSTQVEASDHFPVFLDIKLDE